MAESTTPAKQGLTRGKAILIGILSVVLVAVLYLQFGRHGETPASESAAYRPPRPAVAVKPVGQPAETVTLATAKIPATGPANKEKIDVAAELIDKTRWKSPPLAKVVGYDPFALPAAFPQPPKLTAGGATHGSSKELIAAAAADDAKRLAEAMERLHAQLDELKEQGVHVIIREGDQYVAWINDRKLHVGDKISGFTITAIDPDGGVLIERKESP